MAAERLQRQLARRSCLFLLLLVLAASSAAAQGQNASIIGVVIDQSSSAIPGVSVSVSSPSLQVPQLTVVTNERGEYRVTELPIGVYVVQYDLSGFQSVRRENVRLTLGFVAKLDVSMELGTLAETIVVTGASPVVDVSSATTRNIIVREALEELPTTRNAEYTLAVQSPGVRISAGGFDIGGSKFTSSPPWNSFGRNGDNWQVMDGVMVALGGSGVGNYQDFGALEEAQVQVIGNGASMPANGVLARTILKSGGNQFHGGGFYGLTGPWAQGDNIDDALRARGVEGDNTLDKRYDFSGDMGGYLIRDKLWFYADARRAWDEPSAFGADLTPEGKPGTAPRGQGFWTGKLSYQMTSRHKLVGLYQGNWKYNIRGVGPFNTWKSRFQQDQYGQIHKLEWQGALTSNVTASALYGYWDYTMPGTGFDYGNVGTFDIVTMKYTGDQISSFVAPMHADDFRYTTKANIQWYKTDLIAGSHNFEGGFDFSPSTDDWSYLPRGASGDYQLRFRSGVPFQVVTYNSPVHGISRANYGGLYAQDNWRLGQVTLDLGLRFDRSIGYIPEQTRPAGTFEPAGSFPAIHLATWQGFAPRLGFAWDVTGAGKTVIKGGWGRFNKMRFTGEVTPLNPYALSNTFYTWRDLNGDKFWDPSQVGEVDLNLSGPDFVQRTGRGSGAPEVPNPDELNPKTNQFSLNLEHELLPNLGIRVTGVYTVDSNLRLLVGVDRPFESYNIPVSGPDPGPDGVVGNADDPGRTLTYFEYPEALRPVSKSFVTPTTFPDLRNRYKGAEISANKRSSNGWQLQASYGRIWKDLDANDRRLYDPNSMVNAQQQITEWYMKVGGSYRFARLGLLASANFNGTSGEPYSRTVLVRGGRTITSFVLPVEPVDARHYPNAYLLDVRFEKSFQLPLGQRLSARVDIFNALNTNVVTSLQNRSGPLFETPTVIMPAKIAQFGFTYAF